ncbi:MAG: hypothetical protein JOZ50_13085 [Candidatus Eremiobacteraeota bacterium]|nr:hypothetical protein [Candidatus Eremiobacteraeota bacterium]
MARYMSAHALGCLPKPAFAKLCRDIFAAHDGVVRIVAGQIGERLLVEFEARDGDAAAAWLRAHKLTPSWVLRLDYESTDGQLHEL